MQTLSMRSAAALAYERGEEFDPALMPSPDVVEQLMAAMGAIRPVSGPGEYERRRLRQRERRMLARVPDWFSLDDLVREPVAVVHGEPV